MGEALDPQQHAQLLARHDAIRQRMNDACAKAGRSLDDVTLIAVSKNHPAAAIQALYDEGVRDFGESYVQEWQEKAAILPDDIRWHLIGHLQSRKAKYLDSRVFLLHSVDRTSVLKSLNKRREAPMDVLIQVDVANEDSKGGVSVESFEAFVQQVNASTVLNIRGLMALPPYVDDPNDNRPHFELMARLLVKLRALVKPNSNINVLSMGMSSDFDVAIHCGATHVRVGTALFGPRNYGD